MKIHEQFQSAVKAWRKTGDQRFTAFGLTSLSLGAMAAHKYDEAYAALERVSRSIVSMEIVQD